MKWKRVFVVYLLEIQGKCCEIQAIEMHFAVTVGSAMILGTISDYLFVMDLKVDMAESSERIDHQYERFYLFRSLSHSPDQP